MSDDLNTEIKIGADASGVEAGVGKAKRSLKSLSDAAQQAGKDAGAGMGAIGAGGDKSAKDVERATRTMQNSIQRLIAEQKAGAKGSREYWEALANTRGVNTAALRPLLDQLDAAKSATNAAKGAAESWRESLGKIGPMVAAAFSGAALAGFIGKAVSVQREFDVLNSSLKTVTGSSAAAEREMAWLKDFAKETPFGLAQATQGFVKMKALGLDPTRAALTSFGNTASAMGKDLNQMIEAVADASTGEFERLKEFGIKAKKEGDQVSLTFQGVTTTIKNSAAEITQYLENIGNVSFGGAMEERAKTLDGTIAALGDTWDELFRTVSTNNVGGLIFDSVTLANGALEDATTILRALGGAAQDAGRDTGALSTIQSGIATVFETVAVLGANLKFVLVGIGNEIGGLAAQVAQAAQFNFSGVAAIRQAMVADAEAARKEIDATTARILNARKAQEEYARYATRNASAATDPRRVDLGGSAPRATGGVSSGTAKAVKETISEYDKLIKKLSDELPKAAAEAEAAQMGYNKSQAEFLALAGSDVWAKFSNSERARVASLYEGKIASEQAGEAAKELSKAYAEAAAERIKTIQSMERAADSLQSQNDALREEIELIGLSAAQQTQVLQQRNEAIILTKEATLAELERQSAVTGTQTRVEIALAAEIAALKERNELLGAKAGKNAAQDLEKANAEAAKKAQEDWERASEQINSTLTDALMRGFESGKDFAKNLRDTVVNMFKTMVLRPVVSAIVSPISGALLGGMGLATAAQAGQGGASSGVSTALSGASLLGSVGGSLAAGAGWMTGATTLGGSLSAGVSLLGTGSLAGAGAGLGMLAGALGPIALGIGLLSSAFSRKLKDQGIQGTFGGEAGFEGQQYRFYKGGLFRSDKTVRSELDPKLDSGLDAAVRQMQQSMLGLADSFGLPTEAITGFTQSIKLSFNGLDEAGIQAKIQEALTGYNESLASAFIESMENSEVPAWVDRLIGNTDASAVQRLQDVAEWPARLLQSFGTSRDDLVRMFTEGLASGDAMAAGQSVADTLVASIQNAVVTNAAGQIFDIVNQGIVTPMLDAIATGASVADALSQATIDKTIERAKAQAQALAELYGNADFAAAMEQLRTAVGGALGQAGGYLQALPQTLVATQQIDTAAQDAARAAEEAQRAWQQITDGLLADQATLQIELLRAQGREEEALARERALAIEGMDAYQTALYDSNRALRSQIDTLRELGELLPSVIDQYLTPEQRTQAQYSSIAGDLVGAGLSGADVGSLAGALESMSKDQIAQAAVAIYNMAGVTDEMRVALLRAAGSLATLKDEAADAAKAAADAAKAERERQLQVAQSATDAAYSALEREVNARRAVVQDTISDVRSVFDAVGDAARGLYGDVGSTRAMMGAQGQAVIDQALSNARLTGYLPDPEELRKAIAAATGDLGKSVFASKFEEDRSRLLLAGKLSDLESISGDQLTEAEKQLASLDGILENARLQIDTLRGIDTSILGVDTRIAMLADAIMAETAASAAAAAGAKGGGGGGGGGSTPPPAQQGVKDLLGAGGAYYSTLSDMGYARDTGLPWMGQTIREAASELVQAGNARAVYDAIAASGFSLSQADSILQIPAGTAEEWALSVGLPVFHNGTPFVPQTGLALLERGEAVIPRTFNPFTHGAGNAEVVAELRAVREQLAATQAELAAIREHSKRTATAVNGNPDQPAPTYITNKVKTVAA